MSELPVCIVGAGFSGAVIARELANAGIRSVVFDERSHVAGNCHTSRCSETGINVHRYGPHIFHTDKREIWDYINRFGKMMPYVSRVKTTYQGQVYSLPINLHTINQFFGKAMRPEEAREFLTSKRVGIRGNPSSFEEHAIASIGNELYEAFFKGYTEKQWGISPSKLPNSVFKRLPIRFNYDDNYFSHQYQGMPKDGYSPIIDNILDHDLITLQLNTPYDSSSGPWRHIFYSGPIDRYYEYSLGRLGYRTLKFKPEIHDGDFLGVALMNYSDSDVPYTRITEHKHFAPWEQHEKTIIYKEYSSQCGEDDVPYYPIRLVEEKALISRYEQLAESESDEITFIGRLGTYRYLDMDVTIDEALKCARSYLRQHK